MKLSTKGRYAVTAMLDLALHSANRPITLSDISGRQDLSLSYLEQLFSRLRRNGLVSSTRGPGGGYQLARNPRDIHVAEVILAVDEAIDATGCKDKKNCHRGAECLAHDLWTDLSSNIFAYLSGITLEEVITRENIRDLAYQQDSPDFSERSPSEKQIMPGAGDIPSEVTV